MNLYFKFINALFKFYYHIMHLYLCDKNYFYLGKERLCYQASKSRF